MKMDYHGGSVNSFSMCEHVCVGGEGVAGWADEACVLLKLPTDYYHLPTGRPVIDTHCCHPRPSVGSSRRRDGTLKKKKNLIMENKKVIKYLSDLKIKQDCRLFIYFFFFHCIIVIAFFSV